jgi:hypothetical protein
VCLFHTSKGEVFLSELELEDEGFDDEQPSVKEIMSGEFKSPPALEGGYATYGPYQLCGHGAVTNDRCGTFRNVLGCSRVELHNKVVFDKNGVLTNCANKGYFKPIFHSCDKPSCPICYRRGWAIREAGNIEFRLEQSSKRFGLAEHIIVALPPKYWGLSYGGLRHLCARVLSSRGIVGGAQIFHGFRYDRVRQWWWSPHFHVLGYILGGYGKCRGCPKCVKGCGGFIDRNYRLNEVDGCYVKVKGRRKSVFGTAYYQLHHSTIKTDVKRFHIVVWFGICSYRRLKISKELRKEYDERHRKKCPICGCDLVRHEYHGHEFFVIALFRKRLGARESVEGFFDKSSEWSEVAERGSGSYEE